METTHAEPVEILLVEDDQDDIFLTKKAFEQQNVLNNLHVVRDGVDAMTFLRQEDEHADAPRPDIILLDLNLPTMDGDEVLEAIEGEPDLRTIPVVVLTSSEAEEDIVRSYELNANAYLTKPVDFEGFMGVVDSIDQFWINFVKVPEK
ncbi:response regulator [Halonotius roseus]|uniref:Response regulator n=1 Tax=Halonotius roseus TaxID=2511997 RepID=A0A544QM17_9EURY|nr:response regulator [Halonotius roseus]TQQ79638.1 response regulator [Halonotius roseus]